MRLFKSEGLKKRGKKLCASPAICRAALEALEPRWLLSTDIVTNLNDSGAGSLRQTIASAAAGDTIQFASGLSGGTLTLTSGELTISQSLSIMGPSSASLTISGGNSSAIFDITAGANVSISGVTITKGNCGPANDGGDIYNSGTLTLTGDVVSNGAAEIGAGLYNNGGIVTITGGTLSNSRANEQGGGIANASGGTMNITGATISNNTAAQEAGGGIANENATLTLTVCTVSGNTASTDGGGIANLSGSMLTLNNTGVTSNFSDTWAGGIFNFGSATVNINSGSNISSNIALGPFGGGLFNYQGTANINGATFSNNFCTYSGAGAMSLFGTLSITSSTFSSNGSSSVVIGGGLYTLDNSATITNSTFTANQAQYGAGILEDGGGSLVISDSTLSNNIAQDYGGGIYIFGTTFLSNVTLAGNQASIYGGGIITYGTLTLVNTTVSTNQAGSLGGGLFIVEGTVLANNTIVSGNTLTSSSASDVAGTFNGSSSNNLIGTGGSGGLINNHKGNKVGVGANLGPLQNNGGTVQTMALLSGSPAINAGNNTLAVNANSNPLTTDERGTGFARIVGGTVDIGAYEVQSNGAVSLPAVVSFSPLISAPKVGAAPSLKGGGIAVPNVAGVTPLVSAAAAPYTPAQIDAAYGINDIFFNGVTGNGAGQTIAIVDAFNDPNIMTDANTFASEFSLPTFNSGGPTLSVLNQNGGASLPGNATPGTWDLEESLDVEWAHAVAPQANIILFEANSAGDTDLFTAVSTAASTPGVSVVSMSFSEVQLYDFYDDVIETSNDSTFTTPAGHQGVTFLAATGDDGAAAVGYPALSPNVVAVGGTSLSIGTDNSYLGESAWSGGGGGLSIQEAQPTYQSSNPNLSGVTARATPDVSMVADPQTGVEVIDTFDGGTFAVGGTSLATPIWAALIAIVDQGRALKGRTSLDGSTQTLPMLYALPSADFHDITTGDNGFPATPGYDLATGLGSPIANLLVPAMAGFNGTAVWTGLQDNNWYNPNDWNTFSVPNATTNVIINFGNPMANTAFTIGTLTINGGTLQLETGSGGSVVTSLSITGSATLDMTNNHLYIDYGSNLDPLTTIAGYLTTGYNAGAWNGQGVDSSAGATSPSYGLGYADSADPGNPAGLATDQIEIKYTLDGDANLDGVVNAVDFGILAANFNKGATGWDQGDFNYDNVVNAIDFGMLASEFNQGATQSAVSNAAVAFAATNASAVLVNPNSTLDITPTVGVIGSAVTRKTGSAKSTLITSTHQSPPAPPKPAKKTPTFAAVSVSTQKWHVQAIINDTGWAYFLSEHTAGEFGAITDFCTRLNTTPLS